MDNITVFKNDNTFINIFGEAKQNAIILGNLALATEEERIKFYNEVISCEKKLDDILNEKKKIKYIHIDKMRLVKNNEKGYEEVPRIIFYFEDETAVITMSIGVYIGLKRLVSVFGAPPYDFNVIFKEINKGKSRVYTIEIVKE